MLHCVCCLHAICVCLCACMSECMCVWKGKGMTGCQVERRLMSLTQHLHHFITKSSMTNSSGVWQRWGRQEKKLWWEHWGHLNAANIALVMQHVCVTSNVTFTWCCRLCVIFRYGGVTVMAQPIDCHHHSTKGWWRRNVITWVTRKRKCLVTTQSIQPVKYESIVGREQWKPNQP